MITKLLLHLHHEFHLIVGLAFQIAPEIRFNIEMTNDSPDEILFCMTHAKKIIQLFNHAIAHITGKTQKQDVKMSFTIGSKVVRFAFPVIKGAFLKKETEGVIQKASI